MGVMLVCKKNPPDTEEVGISLYRTRAQQARKKSSSPAALRSVARVAPWQSDHVDADYLESIICSIDIVWLTLVDCKRCLDYHSLYMTPTNQCLVVSDANHFS